MKSVYDFPEFVALIMGAAEDTNLTLAKAFAEKGARPLNKLQHELVQVALLTAATAGVRHFAMRDDIDHAEVMRIAREETIRVEGGGG